MPKLAGGRLVSEAKVCDYLLNADHPVGKAKATYFSHFGFEADHHVTLLKALLAHPDENTVVEVRANAYGVSSIVECRLQTPDGRDPCIRSVWFLETGSTIQRLVTAYPAKA